MEGFSSAADLQLDPKVLQTLTAGLTSLPLSIVRAAIRHQKVEFLTELFTQMPFVSGDYLTSSPQSHKTAGAKTDNFLLALAITANNPALVKLLLDKTNVSIFDPVTPENDLCFHLACKSAQVELQTLEVLLNKLRSASNNCRQ